MTEKISNKHLLAHPELDRFMALPEDERFYALCDRYPTFLVLHKVVQRHRRLRSLVALPAPEVLVTKETEMLQEALNELVMAFPPIAGKDVISLPSILYTLGDELQRAHPEGGVQN